MDLTRVNWAKRFVATIITVSVVGLGACETGIDPAILNSAEYSEGFSDGCRTADSQSNGFQSDVIENRALSGTNERYIIGWRQGFYACGGHTRDSKRYDNREWSHDIGD